jgi:hypothetical protein
LSGFIKAIVSGFLIGVFAIGITPKQVLHDVLTHHHHVQCKEKSASWISKDRFSCDDESFAIESPFFGQNNAVAIIPPAVFRTTSNLFFTSYSFLHHFFFELRGPPFIA